MHWCVFCLWLPCVTKSTKCTLRLACVVASWRSLGRVCVVILCPLPFRRRVLLSICMCACLSCKHICGNMLATADSSGTGKLFRGQGKKNMVPRRFCCGIVQLCALNPCDLPCLWGKTFSHGICSRHMLLLNRTKEERPLWFLVLIFFNACHCRGGKLTIIWSGAARFMFGSVWVSVRTVSCVWLLMLWSNFLGRMSVLCICVWGTNVPPGRKHLRLRGRLLYALWSHKRPSYAVGHV